ncbi:MAG: hypothetical protein ACTSPM_07340 [Candidatus Heimdallarchaeota archaeon]
MSSRWKGITEVKASIFSIFAGIIIIIIGIILLIMNISIINGILLFFGIVLLVVGIISIGVYRKVNRSGISSDEFNVDSYLNNTKMVNEKEVPKTKVFTEYLYLQKEIPEGAICMITKIPLGDQKDVLQCPACESYFLGEYLREWVKEKKICPVCKFKLKITIKDKPKSTF